MQQSIISSYFDGVWVTVIVKIGARIPTDVQLYFPAPSEVAYVALIDVVDFMSIFIEILSVSSIFIKVPKE